jgi:hypothetical protein
VALLAAEKARAEALAERARRVLMVPSLVTAMALAGVVGLLVAVLTGAVWAGIVAGVAGLPVAVVVVTLGLDGVGLASPALVRLTRGRARREPS